ncbi:MAG: hypothetical protein FIA92_02895 [Chloroflexi bacterium]|nr:hypothetical protein [Chloroflexota bacterium]
MTDDTLDGRDELLAAIHELRAELAAGAEGWENDSLDRYLEALGALLGSIENAYRNEGRALPRNAWSVMADVVRGARFYE